VRSKTAAYSATGRITSQQKRARNHCFLMIFIALKIKPLQLAAFLFLENQPLDKIYLALQEVLKEVSFSLSHASQI
jgi:predicted RNase H-related nuclease YkuK (DUF458 family)